MAALIRFVARLRPIRKSRTLFATDATYADLSLQMSADELYREGLQFRALVAQLAN